MKFKSRYLQPVLSEGDEKEARNGFPVAAAGAAAATPPPQGPPTATLAYRYPEAFTVDLENGCVRFGFRCLIPGSEGAGTEFLYFDTAGRVSESGRGRDGGVGMDSGHALYSQCLPCSYRSFAEGEGGRHFKYRE